jgi:hypothetical protein
MYARKPRVKGIIKNAARMWIRAKRSHLAGKQIKKAAVDRRSIWSDIVCGWHSGMRPCCILFFLFWIRLPSSVHYFIANMKLLEGYHYIPCPLCYCMNQRHLRTIKCKCCPCISDKHELEWCAYYGSKSKKGRHAKT